MRRGRRRKKNSPPDYAPFGEYSVRTEKNTSAQKHIYHKHITLQQGEHIQLWQAAIRSGAIYFGAGRRPALTAWRYEAAGGSWSGEGSKRVPLQRSSQGSYPAWPWPRPARTGEQEKIRLICFVFGANSCIPSQLFSLSILVPERINFHLQSREVCPAKVIIGRTLDIWPLDVLVITIIYIKNGELNLDLYPYFEDTVLFLCIVCKKWEVTPKQKTVTSTLSIFITTDHHLHNFYSNTCIKSSDHGLFHIGYCI